MIVHPAFKLVENTCLSFSGGRSSAFMVYNALSAHDGVLPADSRVVFANTGKEEEATLRFIQRCSSEWKVPIEWVEYADNDAGFRIVTFDTASRMGEPYETLIRKRKFLPNPVTRFCTTQLKVRPIHKYLASLGWKHKEGTDWVGIRFDEQRRVAKIQDRSRMPLVTAKVTKQMVQEFWALQTFDLELPNINGVTPHGNCDLCFLKGRKQIMSLIEQEPNKALWWIEMEGLRFNGNTSGNVFRIDRPSYRTMYEAAINQMPLFDYEDEGVACYCGD